MRILSLGRPLVLLLGLSSPLACTGDDSSASESATSSTSASTQSTGAETASTSGSTTSAGSGSESASGMATTEDESTSSDTTTDTDTTDTTDTTATTGEPSTTDDTATTGDTSTTGDTTSGGDGEVCDDVGEVDFGDCQTPLGWIFDGAGCVPLSGCDCGDHCDAVFKDATGCAGSCAAAGECNKELLLGSGIAKGPYGVGDFCDEFAVCGDSSDSVADLMPSAKCSPGAEYPCEEGPSCSIGTNGELTEERFEELCAASLLPDVNLVSCLVWGP